MNLYKLNLKNGTLNLKTGLIEIHDRKDFITKVINIVYDPKFQCPNWIDFITKIFKDDQGLIDYIQKGIGYSMTGDANLQCFYILHGNGSNGKGTLGTLDEKNQKIISYKYFDKLPYSKQIIPKRIKINY